MKKLRLTIAIDLSLFRTRQGTEVYSENLIHALVRNAPHHRFLVFKNRGALSTIDGLSTTYQNIHIRYNDPHRTITNPLVLMLYQQLKLPWIFYRERVDIVYSTSPFFSFFTKAKKISTIHDCAYAHFQEFRSSLSAAYIRTSILAAKKFCRAIVTVSNFSKEELITLYAFPEERVHAIQSATPFLPTVDQSFIHDVMQKYNIHPPFFLYVGITRLRKNITGLLHAFKKFLHTHSTYTLVLAGSVDHSFVDVKKEVEHLGIGERIIQTDFLTDEEKVALYHYAVALVFPSYYEGFGFPILEAQNLGLPVLTSSTSSFPEIAGDAAVYVDPYDQDDIVRGMKRIVDDGALRTSLISKGHKNIQRFSWDDTACTLLQLFEKTFQ